MSTIELTVPVDVQEIMFATDASDAQELAEYHDLAVIDPDDPDDPTALAWAELHTAFGGRKPVYGFDLDDAANPTALEWVRRHGYTKRTEHAELRARIESAPWLYLLTDLLLNAVNGDQEPSR